MKAFVCLLFCFSGEGHKGTDIVERCNISGLDGMMVLFGDFGAVCYERMQPPELRLFRIKR